MAATCWARSNQDFRVNLFFIDEKNYVQQQAWSQATNWVNGNFPPTEADPTIPIAAVYSPKQNGALRELVFYRDNSNTPAKGVLAAQEWDQDRKSWLATAWIGSPAPPYKGLLPSYMPTLSATACPPDGAFLYCVSGDEIQTIGGNPTIGAGSIKWIP